MTDYYSSQCDGTKHRVCRDTMELNILKYKNMMVTDLHNISVITANYNKWLLLMSHTLCPSAIVSSALCAHLPSKAQVT